MAERTHIWWAVSGRDAGEAMRTALEILGPRLRSLPDGETGERRNWVISIIESLRTTRPPAQEDGTADYHQIPCSRSASATRLRREPRLRAVAAVSESYPVFREVTAAAGRPDLVFQEGVPGDLDLAMFTLGPAGHYGSAARSPKPR